MFGGRIGKTGLDRVSNLRWPAGDGCKIVYMATATWGR